MEDYYKILKVKPDCTLEELDRKYERLLKEFDPETQSDEGLKDFFKSEQDKIKEAYKEIFSNISAKKKDKELIKDKPKNKVLSSAKKKNVAKKSVKKKSKKIVNKAAQKLPVKKNINKDKKNNRKKFSISSEINLMLKRAYLIVFIIGFPLIYLISEGNFDHMLEVYYNYPPAAIISHLIGLILVLLFHMFIIIKSTGFLSIRENLVVFFTERKIYFIRILAFTPFVLLSLYGWGGMIQNLESKDYWYYRYQEVQDVTSGDNYDSGCNKRKALKIHNQSPQDLRIYISWKHKDGKWSKWQVWEFPKGKYNGIRSDIEKYNNGTIYTTDYRYYIKTLDYDPYLYSEVVPHITNTCNAKCINIY